MSELSKLSRAEKVFLAGCIKTTILADGMIEDVELADLDSIFRRLKFDDYERCLDEFEETFSGEEAFYDTAARITNRTARDLVLRVVDELIHHTGVPTDEQEKIFRKLNEIWQKR
jgi:hypothetical protein